MKEFEAIEAFKDGQLPIVLYEDYGHVLVARTNVENPRLLMRIARIGLKQHSGQECGFCVVKNFFGKSLYETKKWWLPLEENEAQTCASIIEVFGGLYTPPTIEKPEPYVSRAFKRR